MPHNSLSFSAQLNKKSISLQYSRMKIFLASLAVLVLQFKSVFSAAIGTNSEENSEEKSEPKTLRDELHYSKYLAEVMELLRKDDELDEKVNLHDIISNGNLIRFLEDHKDTVRSKLDQAKREELQRIRVLSEALAMQGHAKNSMRSSVKALAKHLDLKNAGSFGTEDLRKLILEANAALVILDLKRRKDFREYEMHKALEFEELIKRLSPEEQAQILKNKATMLADHKRQKPIHVPASKEHLLKVWEERDHLNKENFNAKTFFYLHDLDGNGFLDEYEVKMLIEFEASSYFDQSSPDYDPQEREEELEMMREYAFETVDTDQDHLISLDEFIANTKRRGFDDHDLWTNVKNATVVDPKEYEEYAEKNRAEINRMIDEGKISLDLSGIVLHNNQEQNVQNNKIDDYE